MIRKKLFFNGKIKTLLNDKTYECNSSIYIEGNKIIKTGSDNELKNYAADEKIDLEGKTVYPGFIADHDHFYFNMIFKLNIDCREPYDFDISVFLNELKKRIEKEEKGKLLFGWGFADYKCKQRRFPTIKELDEISPDNPFVLMHTSGHSVVLNTLSMTDSGIPLDKKPEGENSDEVVRDEAGRVTGLLNEAAALKLSFRKMIENFELLSENEKLNIIGKYVSEFNQLGITTVVDPLCDLEIMELYKKFEDQRGLDIRIVGLPDYQKNSEQILKKTFPMYNSERLVTGPVKLLSDGSLSGRTAAVNKPYIGTDNYGVLCFSQEEFDEIVSNLDSLGYSIASHAIGDRAVDIVISSYEKVINKENDKGHRIEHCGIINQKNIERIKNKDIYVSVQPSMLYEQGDGFIESCGDDRINMLYPYKSLINNSIKVGGSSDCPVINLSPILGMKAAVTRQTEKGQVIAPDECLSPEEAVYLYTKGSASTIKIVKNIGSLVEGMNADMVVLDEDLLDIAAEDWNDNLVFMTVSNGEIVYIKK